MSKGFKPGGLLEPVPFRQANANYTLEGCLDLPVLQVYAVDKEGRQYETLITKWRVTNSQIEMLQNDPHIYLCIYGGNLPPVMITVEPPFTEETPYHG